MLWLMSIALAGPDRCAGIEVPKAPTATLMADAETWYWWARASGDDVRLHCMALRALEQADGEAARVGAQAARNRVDNSFDSVRNVYPLAWWMLVQDPVAEPEDGPGDLPDFYERAIEHGWETPAHVLDDHDQPRVNALVRCTGDAHCEGLRDVTARLVDAHPRLQTIPDEVALNAVGSLEPDTVMAEFGLDELLVLDIQVRDTVEQPRQAVRIDLTATVLPEEAPRAVATGIGANHVPSRQLDIVFGLLLMLTAVVMDRQRWRGLVVGAVAGGIYGWFATSWAPFVPPMDAVALTPGGFLRLQTFLWPLGVGALLMLGPPLLVSIGLLSVAQRLPSLTDRLSLTGLVPGAQAGALTVALASACEGLHWTGTAAALSIGLPAVLISRTSGQVLQRLLDGRTANVWAPLGIGTAGLLTLFPFGLMGRWWPAVLVAGVAIAFGCHRLADRRPQAAASARPRRQSLDGGNLRLPRYVGGGNRELERIVQRVDRPGVHRVVVEGPEGVGKSRLAAELRRALSRRGDWRVGEGQAEARLGEVGSTAFGVVSQAMAEVMEAENVELAAVHSRRAALNELAGVASEAALEMLPGVGVLLSMGEADTEQITLDRMRRDLLSSIRQVAADQPLLLIFDDVQWADESSLGLIEHLASALDDPDRPLVWPVVILLLQRPDPGPHQRLSSPEERLVLSGFGADGVERLLAGAGVSAPPEFASMVRDRVGGSPRHVLELVSELEAAELLVREGDTLVVPETLNRADIEEAVPAHLKDLELQRLERLEPTDRVVLHAAAQCGRRFGVGPLAQGLGQDRMDLLAALWRLQAEHGVLEDLPDDESFRFRTELMRSVLVDLAQRRDGRGVHKLLKEFHWRVVQFLVDREDWDELRDSEQLVRHAVLAGERAEGHVVRYATRAASNAARRCAWPEALEWVRVAREPERADSTDAEASAQLDLVEAKVLRGLGGERRRQALGLLRGLIQSPHVDQVEVVLLWFETAFELRTRSATAELLDQIHEVRQTVDTAGRQTLVEAICDFYEVLAQAEHDGIRPGPHAGIARQLGEQVAALRTVQTDRQRERDLLLARILQAMAQRVEDEGAYLDASRESLALKERHGDLAGQALTKGMLGNYFLWWAPRPDPAQARRWLEEDLDLVERMGAVTALSSLHNRIALSFAMEDDHAQALQRAEQALSEARRHRQEADLLFAAFAVIQYALHVGDLDRVNRMGQELTQPPADWPWADAESLFGELPAGVRAAKADELRQFVLPDRPWVDRLSALLG